MIRLSVITVNLNNADGLRRTIESVVTQTVRPFEFIIIDGGSTDGSVEVIRSFEAKLSFWTSEKDSGIYDAMNKGITHTAGDYLLFLNSGDTFSAPDTVSKLTAYEDTADVIHGTSRLFYPDGTYIIYGKKKFMPSITLFHAMIFSHQAAMFKKNLFAEFGLYDTDLRIVSDYDFILKAFFGGKKFLYIGETIADYQLGGISSRDSIARLIEHHMVRRRHYPLTRWIILSALYLPEEISLYKKLFFRSVFGRDIVFFRKRK